MGQQKWTTKIAQDLVSGDIIPNLNYALKICEVKPEKDKVIVTCYTDLYQRFSCKFEMEKDQIIMVAASGITHMDPLKRTG